MTLTRTADRYVVHELLSAKDEVTPCTPPDVMHSSECQGKDIRAGEDGLWRAFVTKGGVAVDAGPILHRGRSCIITITARTFTQSACQDPCIGYVIRESPPFSRKIVILGDTYDPTALLPLCCSPCPSLLIHESTDAHIPPAIDSNPNPNLKRNKENVETKTRDRGHSTPGMAGSFAKLVGARQLVLNHIGSRFPAPQSSNWKRLRDSRVAAMKEVEWQASEAWGEGKAQAAVDFMRVEVSVVSDTSDSGRME